MAEYLPLRLLFLLFLFIDILQRVGHHEVHRVVHLCELLVILVVGVLLRAGPAVLATVGRHVLLLTFHLFLTGLTVGLTHAVLHALRTGGDVLRPQRTVLLLALVLLLDAAYLVDGHAALHQLGDYLLARHALLVLFYHIVHDLIVGHARLCPARTRGQHQGDDHR